MQKIQTIFNKRKTGIREEKMGRGRQMKNWPETIREDLRGLLLMWGDALEVGRKGMIGGNALPDVQLCTGRTMR